MSRRRSSIGCGLSADRQRFLAGLRALRRFDPHSWATLKADPYEEYHPPVNDEEACLNLIHKAYGVPRA